jgi:hypothetical protein
LIALLARHISDLILSAFCPSWRKRPPRLETQPESAPYSSSRGPLQRHGIFFYILCKSSWHDLCPCETSNNKVFANALSFYHIPLSLAHPNLWLSLPCAWRVLALQIHVARGLYKYLWYRIGSGVMESTTELPEMADTAAQHSSTPGDTQSTQTDTILPKAPTTSPSTARRKPSTKKAPPFSMKRAASTPNVRTVAGADALAVSVAEKRRNKLGYHRTSVACGQSGWLEGTLGSTG